MRSRAAVALADAGHLLLACTGGAPARLAFIARSVTRCLFSGMSLLSPAVADIFKIILLVPCLKDHQCAKWP